MVGYRGTTTCARCGRAVDERAAARSSGGLVCATCEADEPVERRSPISAIVFALIFVLGVGGTAAWYLLRDATVPSRVLVVVDGGSPETEDFVRRRLARHLGELGFDARPTEEETAEPLPDADAALERARDLGAGFLVHVAVQVRAERPGIGQGHVFVVADATTRVVPTVDGEPSPDAHVTTFAVEGVGMNDALARMEDAWATVAYAQVAGDLFGHPLLSRFVEEGGELADMGMVGELRTNLPYAAGQARTATRLAEVCAEATRALVHEAEPAVRCLSAGCDEEYAFDVTPDGAAALVHVESPAIYVPFGSSPAPRVAETVERIELRPLDGGAARPLAWARNFFGYGDLSEDGSTLVFVEDGSAFGLVTVDVDSGERRVPYAAEPPRQILQPELSADGSRALFYERPGHRGRSELKVVSTREGGEPLTLGTGAELAQWVVLPLRPGEAAQPLVVARFRRDRATPDRRPHAVLMRPDDPGQHVRIGGEDRDITEIAGAVGSGLFLGWQDGARCGVGRYDAATGQTAWTDTDVCVGDLTVADDGMLIGVARTRRDGDPSGGDDEVAVIDPGTGAITALTANAVRDRYPRAPARGRRVVFERLTRSQFDSLRHVAVCWTER